MNSIELKILCILIQVFITSFVFSWIVSAFIGMKFGIMLIASFVILSILNILFEYISKFMLPPNRIYKFALTNLKPYIRRNNIEVETKLPSKSEYITSDPFPAEVSNDANKCKIIWRFKNIENDKIEFNIKVREDIDPVLDGLKAIWFHNRNETKDLNTNIEPKFDKVDSSVINMGFMDQIDNIISNNTYRFTLGLLSLLFLLIISMYFIPPVNFVLDPHTITMNITDENNSSEIITIKNLGINLKNLNLVKEGPVNIVFNNGSPTTTANRNDIIFWKATIINTLDMNEAKGKYRGIIKFQANTNTSFLGIFDEILQERQVIKLIPVEVNYNIKKKSINYNATLMSNTTISNLIVANLTVNNLTIQKEKSLGST